MSDYGNAFSDRPIRREDLMLHGLMPQTPMQGPDGMLSIHPMMRQPPLPPAPPMNRGTFAQSAFSQRSEPRNRSPGWLDDLNTRHPAGGTRYIGGRQIPDSRQILAAGIPEMRLAGTIPKGPTAYPDDDQMMYVGMYGMPEMWSQR